MFFADIPLAEFAPILAIIAGMLVGFYGIAKLMLVQGTKDREADRKERQEFVIAIRDMAESNREIAEETKKGNKEAKARNGHLAELTIQSKEDTIKAISTIKVQHVENQTVEHEHVKDKS